MWCFIINEWIGNVSWLTYKICKTWIDSGKEPSGPSFTTDIHFNSLLQYFLFSEDCIVSMFVHKSMQFYDKAYIYIIYIWNIHSNMPIKVLMIFLIIQYSLQKNNSLHDYYIINLGGGKKKILLYYKVNVNIFNTYHTASSDIYFSMQFVINAGLNDQSFIFMKYIIIIWKEIKSTFCH